jgi:glycosyltransferase involved in cell wall biosynthesis
LKILLVHNFYGSSAPSGENQVYLSERELLKAHGHQVLEYLRHSDAIRNRGFAGMLKGALATPWNPFSLWNIRHIIQREKPDVMHVHNSFPLISPAVFRAARGHDTATVLTLHNYRLFCAAAIPMRNGKICTECIDRRCVVPSIQYGCYRNSRIATLPLAAMIALHRALGTWKKDVDAFIALTGFQKNVMSDAGLPKDSVHIKPHFYADPPDPLPWEKRQDRVVFIGRLADYKGVHVLVDAWNRWGENAPALDIIGEGPSRSRLQTQAAPLVEKEKIRFLGQLPFHEAQERLSKARMLVLPSLCFEGFPMVIREAFALGVPVVASRLGSLSYLIRDGENGFLFKAGEADELTQKTKQLWGAGDTLLDMSKAARKEFERKYMPQINYETLLDIYQKATEKAKSRGC